MLLEEFKIIFWLNKLTYRVSLIVDTKLARIKTRLSWRMVIFIGTKVQSKLKDLSLTIVTIYVILISGSKKARW